MILKKIKQSCSVWKRDRFESLRVCCDLRVSENLQEDLKLKAKGVNF